MNKIPKFNNKSLFDLAFTHRSYLNESNGRTESNERLEFLGDSILSFVVSTYIYDEFKEKKEGELTSLRSVLTNTETLYEVAKKLNLGENLKLSKGEEETGGRESKTILANTYEAVVGAIYLDQGIEPAKKFIFETIIEEIDSIVSSQGLKDSKSALQEYMQESYKASPRYEVLEESGPDHDKIYTVGVFFEEKLLAKGDGKSKQEAEKKAAQNAMQQIEPI
jgi:ribonuclease-3